MNFKNSLAILLLGTNLSSTICWANASDDPSTLGPSPTTTTTTSGSGSAALGAASTSINANLNGAKSSNTTGMIMNAAGAGLHGLDAAASAATCAGCLGGCFTVCARAVLQGILAVNSISQLGKHGQSNQAIIPEICKTAAGTCNPGSFNWPDFNSCGSNTACYQSTLASSTNPDLTSIFGGGPNGGVPIADGLTTGSVFSSYDSAMAKLANIGAVYNPATGVMSYKDKSFKPEDMKSPGALQKMLGLSDEDMAKIEKSNQDINAKTAKLANDAKVKAAADGELQAAAAGLGDSALAGGGYGGSGGLGANGRAKSGGVDGSPGTNAATAGGVALDTVGGAGAAGVGSAWGEENDPNGAGKSLKMSKELKDRFDRVPAAVAGKKRNFNGEQIGVAGDSIFDMMTRRYQVKVLQNTFLDPALVDPK